MLPHGLPDQNRKTHLLIWLLAIICTIISIAVIIAGIGVFVGYMVIHPRVPVISIVNAHLDKIQNDIAGTLGTQLTIVIRAENDNLKAHASFSETTFIVTFQGIVIAKLVADPFDVSKNSTQDLNYLVQSSSIPLNSAQMTQVDLALKQNLIKFEFSGSSRARWRVGLLGSVKFWCHLNCLLRFHPLNGTHVKSPCTSRAK